MSMFKFDPEAAARVRDAIRRADLAMREMELKHRARKHWIREARKQAGGPCRATTKLGKPCQRKGAANGLCWTHGGLTAGQLWERMEGEARRNRHQSSGVEPAVFLPTTRTRARARKKA
jgi:hypothetical protein